MSATDRFLQFFFSHQLMLIEVFFALILGVCAIWLFVHLQKDEAPQENATDSHGKGPGHAKDKGHALDAVTGQAMGAGAVSSGGSMGAAGGAAASAAAGPLDPNAPKTPGPIKPLVMTMPQTPIAPIGAAPGPAGGSAGPAPLTAAAPIAPAGPVVTPVAAPISTPAAGVPAAATAQGGGPSPDELAKLKKENEEKSMKLAALQTALEEAQKAATNAAAAAQSAAAAGGGAPSANVAEYEKKIQELESRLGEYEIIEDDIANLSLYKEENARLKNELQKVKKDGAKPTEAVSEAAAAPAAEEELASPDLDTPAPVEVAEKAGPEKAATPEKVPEQAKAPETTPAAAPAADAKAADGAQAGADGGQKLIEEFESFMKGAGR